jgi:hypothetical protein
MSGLQIISVDRRNKVVEKATETINVMREPVGGNRTDMADVPTSVVISRSDLLEYTHQKVKP